MSRKASAKVRINKLDAWRAVLTDTTPFELPIIISNDGFYRQLHGYEKMHADTKRVFDALIRPEGKSKRSRPYKFRIVKDELSFRELSLVSPQSQIEVSLFYEKYSELICYYCSQGNFSMRFPRQVGSVYFTPSADSDANKYREATVDDLETDKTARNPASYFAYSGFQQLHQFFSSDSYIQLEKRYAFTASMDVQRCFDSIYTHSIAWAIKGKDLAKSQSDRMTFGGVFDCLMQDLNWGETNGICIGPEVARIFAEVIFSRIDAEVEKSLEADGYKLRDNYDCRRYVDNYYFFADSEEAIVAAQRCLISELKKYNLHLNEAKTEILRRPFYTPKSRAISSINEHLNDFFQKVIDRSESDNDGARISLPRKIIRHRSVFNDFATKVKDACFGAGVGYDSVSNYVLGALRRAVVDVTESFERCDPGKRPDETYYEKFLLVFLDLSFYFLNLHPTVPSSLRVAHAAVLVSQFIDRNDLSFSSHFQERLLRWVNQLIKTPVFSKLFTRHEVIPIELWNMILCLAETSLSDSAVKAIIDRTEGRSLHGVYFRTVSKLYLYKDKAAFGEDKNSAILTARRYLSSSKNISADSAHVHLFLDLMACPYIDEAQKIDILLENWGSIDNGKGVLPALATCSLSRVVRDLGKTNWFTSWDGVDLLRLIEKRELSRVYA